MGGGNETQTDTNKDTYTVVNDMKRSVQMNSYRVANTLKPFTPQNKVNVVQNSRAYKHSLVSIRLRKNISLSV